MSPKLQHDDSDDESLAIRPAAVVAVAARPRFSLLPSDTSDEDDTDDDDKPLVSKVAVKRKATTKKRPQGKKCTTPRSPQKSAKTRKTPTRSKNSPAPRQTPSRLSIDNSDEEEPSIFKQGQIKVCPPLGDAQRAFYESLLAENSKSIIAIKYCVEQGVLIGTQAKAAFAQYKILKDAGAFKALGGVKKEIINGLDE